MRRAPWTNRRSVGRPAVSGFSSRIITSVIVCRMSEADMGGSDPALGLVFTDACSAVDRSARHQTTVSQSFRFRQETDRRAVLPSDELFGGGVQRLRIGFLIRRATASCQQTSFLTCHAVRSVTRTPSPRQTLCLSYASLSCLVARSFS